MKHLLTLLAACAVALSMTSCASKGMPKFDLNTAELAKAAKQLPKEKRLDFTTQAGTLLQTIAQQA